MDGKEKKRIDPTHLLIPQHKRSEPAIAMLFLESQPLSATRGMVLRLKVKDPSSMLNDTKSG